MSASSAPPRMPAYPPRIAAAFALLRYLDGEQRGCVAAGPEGPVLIAGRPLDHLECGARNAALNLLRNWLNGEQSVPMTEGLRSSNDDFESEAA